MVCFVWSWTRSNTFRLCEDSPQNHSQNGLALEEVSELVVSCFLPYSHQLLSHVVWSVLCNIELAQIPPHSVEMLHKMLMKWFSHCGGMWTFIFDFLPLCSPTAQYLTVEHFTWACARLDTYILPQVLLYSGRGQYNVYSLLIYEKNIFMWGYTYHIDVERKEWETPLPFNNPLLISR